MKIKFAILTLMVCLSLSACAIDDSSNAADEQHPASSAEKPARTGDVYDN